MHIKIIKKFSLLGLLIISYRYSRYQNVSTENLFLVLLYLYNTERNTTKLQAKILVKNRHNFSIK